MIKLLYNIPYAITIDRKFYLVAHTLAIYGTFLHNYSYVRS